MMKRRTKIIGVGAALAVVASGLTAVEMGVLETSTPGTISLLPKLPSARPVKAPAVQPTTNGDYTNPPSGPSDAPASAADRIVQRTENADVSVRPDGVIEARVSQGPRNYQAADGTWNPIDLTLARSGGRIRPASTSADISFASTAAGENLVSYRGDGWSVSMSATDWVDEDVTGKLDANNVWYRGVVPNTDLGFSVLASEIKSAIRLNKRPRNDDPTSWTFALNLKGATARQSGDDIEIVHNGKVVATIPSGLALDGKHGGNAATTKVHVKLVEDGDAVEMSVSRAWLNAKGRTYPVVVDPSVVYRASTGESDAFVGSGCGNCNYNGGAQIDDSGSSFIYTNKIGKSFYNGGNWEWYSYARWNLPVLGGNHPVTYGHFRPHIWSANVYPATFNIYPVSQDWNESTLSWGNKPYHTGEVILAQATASGQRLDVDMTTWVKSWADGTRANYGLAYDTGGANRYVRMAAAESAPLGTDAALDVQYPNTSPPSVSAATLSPSDKSVITTTTPTLTAGAVTDADADPVKYWFRVTTGNNAETGHIIDSGWIGGTSFTIPSGVLQNGQHYYWQVYTWDGFGNNSPGSGPIEFKVDRRLGEAGVSPVDTIGPVGVNLATGNVSTSFSSPSFQSVAGAVGVDYRYDSQGTRNVLRGSYYNQCNASRPPGTWGEPVLVRDDAAIDFNWGTASPAPGIVDADNFCVHWDGYINVPVAATWCFNATSDDGLYVAINGVERLNRWDDGVVSTLPSGIAASDPGCVDLFNDRTNRITVDYFDSGGGASVKLFAQGTANGYFSWVPVTADWLSNAPVILPRGWSASMGLDNSAQYTEAIISATSFNVSDISGTTHHFTQTNDASSYAPEAGEDAVVRKSTENGATVYLVLDPDGTTSVFNDRGRLTRVETATDPAHPAALVYGFDTNGQMSDFARTSRVTDPVSGRSISFVYSARRSPAGTDNPCYETGTFSSPPIGMLCKVNYWNGTSTTLHYDAAGRMVRIEDPGNEITDLAYDGLGGLTAVRDPLSSDSVSAGVVGANDATWPSITAITYDTAVPPRATKVQLPAEKSGGTRVTHSYGYPAAATSTVAVVGLSMPNGFARRVTYNAAGQTVTDADTIGTVTTNVWGVHDQLLSSVDRTGRQSTQVYDFADRVTDSYGPSPVSCFGPDRRPNGTCSTPVPHTSSEYDGGIQGLAATWWSNTSLAGTSATKTTGLGAAAFAGGTSSMVWHNWGTGAPNPSVPADGWSARFTGDIAFPAAGTYSLDVWTKNGYRVWIDDQLKSDKWIDPNASPAGWAVYETNWYQSGPGFTVAVGAAGEHHRIRIETFDSTGESGLRLLWLLNGTWSGVPGSALSPHYGLVTKTTTDDSTPGSPATVTANQFDRPELGLLSRSIEDPTGQALTTSNTYEAEGPGGYFRRMARQMPGGAQSVYAYYGNTETSSGCGAATNQAGLLKSKTWPTAADGTTLVQQYEYDAQGRVRGTRYGAEGWSCATYDARGRMTQRTVLAAGSAGPSSASGSLLYTYSYAAPGGSPLQSTADVCSWGSLACLGLGGTITTTTDLLGRVAAYTDGLGKTSTTTYDLAGRPSDSLTAAGAFHSVYDAQNRNIGFNVNGTSAATMTYNAAEELDTVTYPAAGGGAGPGLSVKYGRDANGRLNDLWWRDAASTTITRDQVSISQSGRVVDETIDGNDANPAGNNFGYDTVGRLVDADVRGHHLQYGYAASGGCGPASAAGKNSNRTSTTDSSLGGNTTTTACYDNADRLVAPSAPGATPITYDSHGNVTSLGGVTYVYDGANRHIATIDATTKTNYVKDATDRVVSRTVTNLAGSLTNVGGATSWNNASTPTAVTPTSWGRSLRIDRPAGSVTGDLLIASITLGSAGTVGTPSGWTPVRSTTGNDVTTATFIHTVTAGDQAEWLASLPSSARRASAVVAAYSGATGVEASAGSVSERTGTHDSPTITLSGSRTVVSVTGLGRAAELAPAVGWTLRQQSPHLDNSEPSTVVADRSATAGSVPGDSVTATQTGSSADQTLVLSGSAVAFRSASSATNWRRSDSWSPNVTADVATAAPGGVHVNDLLIVAITTSGGAAVTAPVGWTSIRQTTGGGVTVATFRKTATGTETQEQFGIGSVGGAPGRASVVLEVYRGADITAPIESSADRATPARGRAHSAAAVTTLAANDIVFDVNAFTSAAGGDAVSGNTERHDSSTLDRTWGPVTETSDRGVVAPSPVATRSSTSSSVTTSISQSIVIRAATGDAPKVQGLSYSGPGDGSAVTLDGAGAVVAASIGLPGGAMLTNGVYSLPNIHGDIVKTGNAVGWSATQYFDPFGNTLDSTPILTDPASGKLEGWLGTHRKVTEPNGAIEMGARLYLPSTGRFLGMDPIEGGTSNDYTYNADPVNRYDLDGNGRKHRRSLRHSSSKNRKKPKINWTVTVNSGWVSDSFYLSRSLTAALSRRTRDGSLIGDGFDAINDACSDRCQFVIGLIQTIGFRQLSEAAAANKCIKLTISAIGTPWLSTNNGDYCKN